MVIPHLVLLDARRQSDVVHNLVRNTSIWNKVRKIDIAIILGPTFKIMRCIPCCINNGGRYIHIFMGLEQYEMNSGSISCLVDAHMTDSIQGSKSIFLCGIMQTPPLVVYTVALSPFI